MGWKWQHGREPEARVSRDGGDMELFLPIEVDDGERPQVRWTCADDVGSIEVDPLDARHARLTVAPSNAGRRVEVHYAIRNAPSFEGDMTLDPPRKAAKRPPGSGVVPSRHWTDRASGAAIAHVDGPRRCWVEVRRGRKWIRKLRREVEVERTLTIGRYSAKQGPLGLDLSGVFERAGDEKLCSSLQAEVYWSDNRLVLVSRGAKNRLRLRAPGCTERELPCGAKHFWAPEEVVLVPGGLELHLREGVAP